MGILSALILGNQSLPSYFTASRIGNSPALVCFSFENNNFDTDTYCAKHYYFIVVVVIIIIFTTINKSEGRALLVCRIL